MTISKKLFISFSLILTIIVFIIAIFFYSTFNLNDIHILQKHRYEQIRKVEKLKEYNSALAWIVLDITVDKDKKNIVKDRTIKAGKLFKELFLQKKDMEANAETEKEKSNIILIFSYFEQIEQLIKNDLNTLVVQSSHDSEFQKFNKKFEIINQQTNILITQEIFFLQNRLDQTEKEKEDFINKIKIELVVLLFTAFFLSFIISSRLIKDIQIMLRKLNKGVLQLLSNDEQTIKIDIGKNNELSEITENFNTYLQQKEDIIQSREELLRNISHELKTPITKGKFLLEKLKEKQDLSTIQDINNVLYDIEELTSKLLEREKLNFATLNRSSFKVTTLILESLSKLSIDDESKVLIDIEDDFEINADIYYMTIVLKNLIDNAMKYSIKFPIQIKAVDNSLIIQNSAKKLSNGLLYYLQPFTREPNQQKGHGLGLNIVNKILQLHNFELHYKHKEHFNIFTILFKK